MLNQKREFAASCKCLINIQSFYYSNKKADRNKYQVSLVLKEMLIANLAHTTLAYATLALNHAAEAYAAEICGTFGKRREITVVIAKNAKETHRHADKPAIWNTKPDNIVPIKRPIAFAM
ncbi:hypothetical protein VCR3J2_450027 [Vibrio coralliirubri]|nr:hypothetical protein VCR6J2_460026 [Vibrio coralliirubri]CDT57165.1 hypothetical protein VCR1J2_620027 [Vibrio coralliirubri]CDT89251.1 hypothetical protein VCR26J2_50026 [Vibrio coralliirubri]CDT96197.1 hypothetical protein VCR8J2_500027 [Vibrio coralliirubri]CDT98544.1 hypothetical protein VCR3J2_450027 [Vibrio coralliirubri]